MRKVGLVLLAISMFASLGFGQALTNYQMGGVYVAHAYGGWSQKLTSAASVGASTVSVDSCTVTSQGFGGKKFLPWFAGNQVKILDGSSETVTITAATSSAGACSFTATFSNAHKAGAFVIPAADGLYEAMQDAQNGGGGIVNVGSDWLGTSTNITGSALLLSKVIIKDSRGPVPQFYALRPSAVSLIAAPSAPTIVSAAGALSSGAYRAMAAYVDALGGVSLASTDSTQSGTITGMTIASPAAATGAVGWLPYITAAAGGTGTEILAKSPIDTTICTLTTLESVIPACAIGATATITVANPSSTAKPVVESNAFSTMLYQAFNGNLPTPFVNDYPFGVFVATGTLNNSNADAAQFVVPAGYFNKMGGTWDLCIKGATGTQVASSILTVNVKMANEYAQSPVTVSAIAFPTQTQAAAGTFQGCVTLTTSTLGASGKVWASSHLGPWINFLNSAPGTQVVSADASAAASSAIDLTKLVWVSVNLAGSGGANITVPIINSVSIRQVQ